MDKEYYNFAFTIKLNLFKMNTKAKFIAKTGIFFLIFIAPVLNSCKKDSQTPVQNIEANKFIYDNTTTWYLWEQYIPTNIDYTSYEDPKNLFEAMMYRTLDHWSAITENYQDILNSFNGIETSPGYKLRLYKLQNSNNIFGIIEYVYDGSPAANAGLVRGNIIIKVNDQTLNTTNYIDLLTQETTKLGFGQIVNGNEVDLSTSATVTAVVLTTNPVLQYSVIDAGGEKIGYLLYDQFIQDYFTDLQDAISYFNTAVIDDLVLDLRYNPGGYVSTCAGLASMLAPSTALDKVFIKYAWNANTTSYFTSHYGPSSELFIQKFPVPSVNLNLSRMVVLTSDRSASASEAIINGLKPYMNVTIIGDTTVGKYTGGTLFYDSTSVTNTYGFYIMINKIANSNGVTDFVDGFAPNYFVQDDYTTPLGDVNEPLLAKAIEVLTGTPAKKASKPFDFVQFDKLYKNKFEKEGLMINDFNSLKKMKN
jgi:carboxyl-terminal processing protease